MTVVLFLSVAQVIKEFSVNDINDLVLAFRRCVKQIKVCLTSFSANYVANKTLMQAA